MRLRLTLAAEFDLEHIRDTIISENPAAAEKVQRAIAKAILVLRNKTNFNPLFTMKG